ncbi:MAG: NAC domain-containing protein, partial [Candidatus Aenigmatarchaeota archaeon]
MENIEATEVIIKSPEGDIIIKNPQVSKVCMGSTETFQVMGDVVKEDKAASEDIKILMEKTGVSEERAKELMAETGDLISAIKRAKE